MSASVYIFLSAYLFFEKLLNNLLILHKELGTKYTEKHWQLHKTQ